MRKGGVIIGIFLLAFTGLVSAYGSYNFSLGEFLDNVDQSTLILGCLFLIFFVFCFFALSKFFKDKNGEPIKALAAVVSFSISLLAIYGINKTGLDFEELLYSLGLNEEILGILIPLILIAGFLFMLWKLKSKTLLIFGGLFIVIALATDWVYEKGTLLAIGIGLGVLYFIIKLFSKKKGKIGGALGKGASGIGKGIGFGAGAGWQGAKSGFGAGKDAWKRGQEKRGYSKSWEEAHRENERRDRETKETQEIANQKLERAKQIRRNLKDLKQKYMAYLFQFYKKGVNIHQQERILQAMRIIIDYAKRAGVSEEYFLSKEIGGNNAKSPDQIKGFIQQEKQQNGTIEKGSGQETEISEKMESPEIPGTILP